MSSNVKGNTRKMKVSCSTDESRLAEESWFRKITDLCAVSENKDWLAD